MAYLIEACKSTGVHRRGNLGGATVKLVGACSGVLIDMLVQAPVLMIVSVLSANRLSRVPPKRFEVHLLDDEITRSAQPSGQAPPGPHHRLLQLTLNRAA
jgi:hypothetical protein